MTWFLHLPPIEEIRAPAAAVDQSRVLQTIERVFAELQRQRQSLSESCHYWITTGNTTSPVYCTQAPRLAQAPQSDSNCGRRTNVLVIIKIILCSLQMLTGELTHIYHWAAYQFFIRRGFSHQRFHSDALISFDSQSDLCLGSSLPIWILMLSHHLDYH